MKTNEPFIPITLCEISGCLCILMAVFLGMVPGGSGQYIPHWIAFSFPFFILGLLWRIHIWQQFYIRQQSPKPPPINRD